LLFVEKNGGLIGKATNEYGRSANAHVIQSLSNSLGLFFLGDNVLHYPDLLHDKWHLCYKDLEAS